MSDAHRAAGTHGDPGTGSGERRNGWRTLEDVEREYMEQVLRATKGQIAGRGGAAEILGLNPSTLRSRMKKLGLIAVAVMASVVGAEAQVRVDFYDFGGGFPQSCSADGSVVVGTAGNQVFRWTESSGLEIISPPNDFLNQIMISDDGSTVVANTWDPAWSASSAGYWTEASGWVPIGGLPWSTVVDGAVSSGWGISGDGSVVTGLAWVAGARAEAFRWTAATGMLSLGREPDASSRASGVSADGSVVVGWYGHSTGAWRPVRWSAPLFQPDMFLGETADGEAYAASGDGTYVVGKVNLGAPEATAYIFDDLNGHRDIGTITGYPNHRSMAIDVSSHGAVVGWSGNALAGAIEAYLWTEQAGIQRLSDLLVALGLDLGNRYLQSAKAISADGTIIYGDAFNPDTQGIEMFRAVVPSVVFGDGFESGDTSAWSVVTP